MGKKRGPKMGKMRAEERWGEGREKEGRGEGAKGGKKDKREGETRGWKKGEGDIPRAPERCEKIKLCSISGPYHFVLRWPDSRESIRRFKRIV